MNTTKWSEQLVNPTVVLVVDDEVKLCRNIAYKLKKEGFSTLEAYQGKTAVDIVKKTKVDVVILDFMLTDTTGLDVLHQIKQISPETVVYMLTAHGNIENAVAAMKLGAEDFFNKPIELKVLTEAVKRLSLNPVHPGKEELIWQSKKMKQVLQWLEPITQTDASVMLLGESGVGKTALAKWIHSHSERAEGPFISINCAAIPENLLESELFGVQKGAFTGATESRAGKFEAANGGTIFLDEIGEISLPMQAKLLHVIEEKKLMRLGSHTEKAVDIRILSATNKPVRQLVQDGKFRNDLYYRLNVVEIEIPPLRERKEDIPFLLNQQLQRLNQKYKKALSLSTEAVQALCEYAWPGNIRELLNVTERTHILKRSGSIEPEDLTFDETIKKEMVKKDSTFSNINLQETLDNVEVQLIEKALQESGGNQTKAADLLGISRNTLIYKMKKLRKA
ncbi:sigma-54 dependent transcriptional regulator [Neobacillus cucumis]|uniref:sigma-54-dependent transcriptional regulator n=1 Tax=Neobacillus cucumis TaxID=1740721 RepID=UPI002E1C44E4|nr:sigma-54 dependent transcriptional regulator [Neobacillus cucumis]